MRVGIAECTSMANSNWEGRGGANGTTIVVVPEQKRPGRKRRLVSHHCVCKRIYMNEEG